jgi:hypothetical protein
MAGGDSGGGAEPADAAGRQERLSRATRCLEPPDSGADHLGPLVPREAYVRDLLDRALKAEERKAAKR